jgi:hypothetical protein
MVVFRNFTSYFLKPPWWSLALGCCWKNEKKNKNKMLNMVLIVSRRCNIIDFQQNVQGEKSPMVGGGIPKIRGLRQGGGGAGW